MLLLRQKTFFWTAEIIRKYTRKIIAGQRTFTTRFEHRGLSRTAGSHDEQFVLKCQKMRGHIHHLLGSTTSCINKLSNEDELADHVAIIQETSASSKNPNFARGKCNRPSLVCLFRNKGPFRSKLTLSSMLDMLVVVLRTIATGPVISVSL